MPSREEIEAQQELLETNRRTLRIYLRQRDQLGSAHTPPGTITGIEEARDKIAQIKQTLREWGAKVEDHTNDEEPKGRQHANMPKSMGDTPPPRLQRNILIVVALAVGLFAGGYMVFRATRNGAIGNIPTTENPTSALVALGPSPTVNITTLASATAIPETPSTEAATATLRSLTNTPVENQPSTPSTEATTTALINQATLAYGPFNNSITSPITNTFVAFIPHLRLHNLIMSATFHNPYGIEKDKNWSYGFSFRIIRNFPSENDWESYRVTLRSMDSFWLLEKETFIKGDFQVEKVAGRKLRSIDTATGGLNKLQIFVMHNVLFLYINDEFVERVNVSDMMKAGEVAITSSAEGSLVKDTNTKYDDFTIWTLDP